MSRFLNLICISSLNFIIGLPATTVYQQLKIYYIYQNPQKTLAFLRKNAKIADIFFVQVGYLARSSGSSDPSFI